MPLTSPPAQKALPAPVISNAPTFGSSPHCLIIRRSAGVSLSESALRASGRLSVISATRSLISHNNSLVPVSTSILSPAIASPPVLQLVIGSSASLVDGDPFADAVLEEWPQIVGGADCWPVIRHFHDTASDGAVEPRTGCVRACCLPKEAIDSDCHSSPYAKIVVLPLADQDCTVRTMSSSREIRASIVCVVAAAFDMIVSPRLENLQRASALELRNHALDPIAPATATP